MKNRLFVLLLVFCTIVTNAQNVTNLSPSFKEALVYNICTDTNGDGILDSDVDTNNDLEIQVSEASIVTNLTMGPVVNYNGISAFTSLETMDCSGGMSSLVISDAPALKTIICYNPGLYSVNLSGLPQLETLKCSGGNIFTWLIFSDVPNLKTLECIRGHIFTLDVSNLPALETLNCSQNMLTSLIVAPDNNIKNLNCSNNNALQLDLSLVPNLKSLQYTSGALTSIDLSPLTQLEKLDCSSNPLYSLDLTPVSNLKELTCRGNYLTTLDLNNTPNLESLDCSSNSISSLDPSGLSNLRNLDCSVNNMTSLNIGSCSLLETLKCNKNDLIVLETSNLSILKELNCAENLLTALPVATLTQLQTLDCNKNQISALDLSALSSLKTVDCGENNIGVLDLSSSANLTSLTCDNNQITTLNLNGITAIETLICHHNEISELDITPFLNIEKLSCGWNNISTMNFDNLTKLTDIDLTSNLFTTLDFSLMGGSLDFYQYLLDNNPNLTYVNIKNGAPIRHLSGHHHCPSKFGVTGCPNLQFVCVDDFNMRYLNTSGAAYSSYCSFTPGGNYNTISGTLTFDFDNSGCDENDHHFSNMINITDGTLTGATFTNSSGYYSFFPYAGSHTISPVMEHPYFTVSPEFAVINFEAADGSVQTQNFCVTPNGVHNDVEITIIPLEILRPGFVSEFQLLYKNKGNQILSGDINLTFDDAVLDFNSTSTALAGQALNVLTWTYDNLLPFESRIINFTLNVNSPQETPPVNTGDILTFIAVINPVSGDSSEGDNTFTLRETVVGSYDPNDKTCLEGSAITIDQVGDYLHYVIRFENLGTAHAENIVVKDVIDTERYDVNSLQLISSSHPHNTRISGNKVEFIFEGINLPAAITDEPGSHGHVAFKIKTIDSLVAGDTIANTADIYFDYNFPIATNTATTTVESLLRQNDFEDKSVSIFPNPVKDKLYITAKQIITSIQLYDVQGRLIETSLLNDSEAILNIGKNANGIYFVRIYTENGIKVEKIIKE